MNRQQLLIWAIALLAVSHPIYSAIRHHMPVLDIAAITLLSLYAAKAGAEHVVTTWHRTQNRSTNR
ncbi:hypothetical protein D0Z67_29175 (plasmid) [Streptomyces seoulensis]|uniref:Uncharacterized protein n=1 Tax=Streptomyces seoulensis TaxID=73044 RepID=A0A4P6U4U6_STRSO|nr:hypothetical protein [Streptomyces seoulensis]QBJ94443.1 hypothetical protein D0Z67_29175 [Streptomyces seoulensis]